MITTMTLNQRLDLRKLNTRRLFWAALNREWQDEAVLDVILSDDTLTDSIVDALQDEDTATMLVLVDQAEERGVSPELCALTRAGLRHFAR
jgi:hypothetical protein